MDEISIKFTSKCAANGSTILSSFPFSSGDNITPLLIELGQVRLYIGNRVAPQGKGTTGV